MLVAVKWRTDFAQWPQLIRRNVESLPDGFDTTMTTEDYDQYLIDNQSAFDSWKDDQAAIAASQSGIAKFQKIRKRWTELADKFAFENSSMGISAIPGKTKEVADAFEKVVYYLNANAPTEAIRELDLIPRGETFLTDDRINDLKNKFTQFLITL